MKTAAVQMFHPVLEAIFKVEDGWIELRALPGKDRTFVRPVDFVAIRDFIDEHPAENIFFGVASRKDSSNGRLENCSRIRAVFTDIDFKTLPAVEAQARLGRFPLQPSILINSGAGIHSYWILDNAVDLQRDSSEFRDILRRTARALGGDLAAAEPARVLRVPGTLNLKYDPPVLVTVKQHCERIYSLEDFEFLPQEPERVQPRVESTGSGSYSQDRRKIVDCAKAFVATVPPAIEGQGGDGHTYRLACKLLRDFGLDKHEAFDVLTAWNPRCRPQWSERELQEKIRNAERYGENPIGCQIDELLNGHNGNGSTNEKGKADSKQPDPAPSSEETDETTELPTRYSEDALADLFSARNEHELRFVPEWGWLEWNGQRWRRISDVAVMDRARAICRIVAQSCREDESLKPASREGLARSIASAKAVAAVERLARGDRRHLSEASNWDINLWLFNTPGGTIDLRTGKLQAHRREDQITKIANATPVGECPQWLVFLDRVTGGNLELQSYLQRLAGYSLVGDPSEECLDFFHGNGGNGKGVFLGSLQFGFGEYATTAAAETFLEARGEKHPTDVAKLAGARLVIAQEVDEGQRWDEARVKAMTGRDVLTARFMRQDFFDFRPQFTLIIAGNHRPALKTVDASIRRRFHLVPFTVDIPPDQQDPELKNKLKKEIDGIMAWAVAGCLAWQKDRLNPPAIVVDATAEYLAAEDVFEMWLSGCCQTGPDFSEPVAYLYESHRHWKNDRGESVPGQKTFSARLKDRGFTAARDNSARKFNGLQLSDKEREVVNQIITERQSRKQRDEWWNR